MTAGETALDVVRRHVEALVAHARSALWPERREALESVRRGIAGVDRSTLTAALGGLGVDTRPGDDEAEMFFRIVLTAYLGEVDDGPVTNPDQAALYALSLDDGHATRAAAWYDSHPGHRRPD